MSLRSTILFMTLISMMSVGLPDPVLVSAHEPIFMISHEAPGKAALDIHTEVQFEKQGDERELEVAQEFTYGLTRDLAIGLSIPFVREETITSQGDQEAENGLGDPTVRLKWRFWDKDLPGRKYALATVFESTLPVGDGEGRLGRDKPGFLGGLAHGREGLHWYYFVSTRYRFNVKDNNTKPGDRFHLDAAYGIRPVLRGLEETDIVYFFELNYLHEKEDELGGVADADSGGDFLFFSPEVLISPTNRVMLRGGLQLPILQSLNGRQDPKDLVGKVTVELRF